MSTTSMAFSAPSREVCRLGLLQHLLQLRRAVVRQAEPAYRQFMGLKPLKT